jgi:hypothetical protein
VLLYWEVARFLNEDTLQTNVKLTHWLDLDILAGNYHPRFWLLVNSKEENLNSSMPCPTQVMCC